MKVCFVQCAHCGSHLSDVLDAALAAGEVRLERVLAVGWQNRGRVDDLDAVVFEKLAQVERVRVPVRLWVGCACGTEQREAARGAVEKRSS